MPRRGYKQPLEHRTAISMATTRHGHSVRGRAGSPTYSTWQNMLTRCNTPSAGSYEWYGAKGIGVCKAWLSFPAFLSDMGERPEGKTIDRIDNGRDYSPENCRWATPKEQTVNRGDRGLVQPPKVDTKLKVSHALAGQGSV